jgi:hypothetical protein
VRFQAKAVAVEANWSILKTYTDRRELCEVLCSCGRIGIRRKDHIDSGRTKCCKHCSAKNTAKNYGTPDTYKGVGDLSRTFWSHIKRGAKKRNITFNITIDYAWGLFLKQEKRCALSGIEISLSRHAKEGAPVWSEFTASLDRIDSDNGYVVDNVQWVHKDINYIKRDLVQSSFIDWCKAVAEYRGGSCGS